MNTSHSAHVLPEHNFDVIRSGPVVVLPPLEFFPTSIATCWLRTNGPLSLPQASHRAVDLRRRCLEPINSAHHQEADVWALRHAYFVQQSLHDEPCNVELQGFHRCVIKRENTLEDGPERYSLSGPSCSIVSSSFATDDQCGVSSRLSARCWLTHLLHHRFRVNTSC